MSCTSPGARSDSMEATFGLPGFKLGVTQVRNPSSWQRFVLYNAHPLMAMIVAQYPKVENVQIVRLWCYAPRKAGVERFAETIIHEFSHACSQQLGYVVDDTMEAFGPAYNASSMCLGTSIWGRL
jgi:hypothetical protein